MLRPELTQGPSKPRFELNPEKVTYFTIYAVADPPLQLTFGIADAEIGVRRDRRIYLQTSS